MNARELASQLNGLQHLEPLPKVLAAQAKKAGLVIVYGASDDRMEFEGAIYDEVGCFNGGIAHVTAHGLVKNTCDAESCPHFIAALQKATEIEALWCEDKDYRWTYKTTIPHEFFEVVSEGEPYCRGIVFSLADVGAEREAPEQRRAPSKTATLERSFPEFSRKEYGSDWLDHRAVDLVDEVRPKMALVLLRATVLPLTAGHRVTFDDTLRGWVLAALACGSDREGAQTLQDVIEAAQRLVLPGSHWHSRWEGLKALLDSYRMSEFCGDASRADDLERQDKVLANLAETCSVAQGAVALALGLSNLLTHAIIEDWIAEGRVHRYGPFSGASWSNTRICRI